MSFATPEQVDLVKALSKLLNKLPPFFQRVILGDALPEEWDRLADVLEEAALLARREAKPVVTLDQRN